MAKNNNEAEKNIMGEGRKAFTPDSYLEEHQEFDKCPTIFMENMVLYPGMSIPLTLTDAEDIEVAQAAESKKEEIFFVCLRPESDKSSRQEEDVPQKQDSGNGTADVNGETPKLTAAQKRKQVQDSAYSVGVMASIFRSVHTEQGLEIYLHPKRMV